MEDAFEEQIEHLTGALFRNTPEGKKTMTRHLNLWCQWRLYAAKSVFENVYETVYGKRHIRRSPYMANAVHGQRAFDPPKAFDQKRGFYQKREFYPTPRFAYLRVVKRLKVVQKINWLMGLEFDFIPKLDSELVLVIIDHPQWLNLSKRRIAK